MPSSISESFVIDADVIKAYNIGRDFFLSLGYTELRGIKPTLLVFKKKVSQQRESSVETDNYLISLRVKLNPVGDLQLYSTALLTIRCDYTIKFSKQLDGPLEKAVFKEEVERLRNHLKSRLVYAKTVDSSSASLTIPTPTNNETFGLERPEHADVQAKLIPSVRKVKVGENIGLEIEITNTGKEAALLVKVEEIIPEGFNPVKKPEIYRIEGSCLNMKRKKLLPLKTEEVKWVLRPLCKGVFQLKPRVLYLDERGNSKFCEPEPVTITVKELGIKGWLKGPT